MGERYIINPETGEKVSQLNEGDRILRKQSLDRLENYQTWNIKHFYKGNIEELKELNKELTISEAGFLFKMIPYINYSDCLICHANGRDINQQDLCDITGLSRTRVHEIIKDLIDKDVLYKGKNSKSLQYFVNPWLFARGNTINKVLKSMFKNYKIKVLNVKWKNLKD
jgi:DNA-binding MarR family transcriptional regulator